MHPASSQLSRKASALGSSVPLVSVARHVGVRMSGELASWSNYAYAVSNVPGVSARVSGTVSGVSAVCPVSALTGGQSAIAPRVSVRVSARSAVPPEASSVVRQAADKPTVA